MTKPEEYTPEESEPEVAQLLPIMPMEAFEAMADALRPLATGLASFEYGSACFDSLVNTSTDPNTLTREGTQLIDELGTKATVGAKALDDLACGPDKRYLPQFCDDHLVRAVEVVKRVSWILYGGAAAVDYGGAPDSPKWAAVHAYDMVRDAYNDLCAKFDDYEAAQKVAVEKQYEDMGWIKQPNGEWHPTPEMLKEMEAAQ